MLRTGRAAHKRVRSGVPGVMRRAPPGQGSSRGGNAVDGAVASALASASASPTQRPGGVRVSDVPQRGSGESRFLDFREPAPRGASPRSNASCPTEGGNEENIYGGKSVAVPVDTSLLLHALARWGTMASAQVMAPAIRLAEEGFVVTPILYGDLCAHREHMAQFGAGARLYSRPGGTPLRVGDVFRNSQLAATLRRIAEQGRDGFYKGPVAQAVVAAAQRSGGVLDLEDLRAFAPRELAPVRGSYRGYEVISSPPPSSGGAIVIEALIC